ncbi:molybdenum cofactor cytidylyltransferase [Halomonas ventosae]|uniref:Molybdenum cofactor cytidylyltransferase n=1 Tax=Halomonas ventosae TaxID=229007 RepID=A0A4R6ZLZ8_9GAMM|nr:nucleotidyltransferase family protein [Halomonas ventosae]TDR53375.1 molybdenum cofactor cytidylyltransferase [Halomonas ventosae]
MSPSETAPPIRERPLARVVALVMAAGRSRRFGAADKRRARLADGRTLLASAVERAAGAFDDCYVVLREDDDPEALGLSPDICLIRAVNADLGLGSSLADAVGALEVFAAPVAVAVLLGDMPDIAPATLVALGRAARRDTILRPVQGGRPGHPVLFGRALWPELAALRGDRGAREVVRRHASQLHLIPVEDPGIHRDVDTPGDLDAWQGTGRPAGSEPGSKRGVVP